MIFSHQEWQKTPELKQMTPELRWIMKSSFAASAAYSSLDPSFCFLWLIIRRQGSFTTVIAKVVKGSVINVNTGMTDADAGAGVTDVDAGAGVIDADAGVVNYGGGIDTNAGLL